jgi:methanogenic corrinoid protein MtbC1
MMEGAGFEVINLRINTPVENYLKALNEQFALSVGADAYCRDASVAVETAKAYMIKRQGSLPAAIAAGGYLTFATSQIENDRIDI